MTDELTHFINLQIRLDQVLNEFGVNWTWVKKKRTELASAIPEEGLDVNGYHISTVKKGVFASKVERLNPIYYEERVQVSKIK